MGNSEDLEKYMDAIIQDYKEFVHVDYFPQYPISFYEKENIQNDSETKVYAKATTIYDPDNHSIDCHKVEVIPSVLNEVGRYIIYHELTHILDVEQHGMNSFDGIDAHGYSGFHAAQVDLLTLLGANHIDEPILFKMETSIHEIENSNRIMGSTVESYLSNSYETALKNFGKLKEMVNRKNLEPKKAMELIESLFNFWGRQSVCQEYVAGYTLRHELISIFRMHPFEKVLCHDGCNPIQLWQRWLSIHMDEMQVDKVNKLFGETIEFLVENYGNIGDIEFRV